MPSEISTAAAAQPVRQAIEVEPRKAPVQMSVSAKKPASAVVATRVDIPPETGYSVVVDGHFKGHHAAQSAALADAKALKARYPFLRIEIFDAAKKVRSGVS